MMPAQLAKYASVVDRARRGKALQKYAELNWKHFALASGAAIAVPMAVSGINKGVKAAYLGVTKGRDFNSMVEANPELKQMDRVRVQMAFNTLRRFAPDLSKDPLVAGTWVKRTADYDMIDHKSVGELISANRALESSDPVEFNPAIGSMLLAAKKGPSPKQLRLEEAAKFRGRQDVVGTPLQQAVAKGRGEMQGRYEYQRGKQAPGPGWKV
jgi:hypothetical protein